MNREKAEFYGRETVFVGDHPHDPCYLVESADGHYIGHSGEEDVAEQFAEDMDEASPEDGPHRVKETSFVEAHRRLGAR